MFRLFRNEIQCLLDSGRRFALQAIREEMKRTTKMLRYYGYEHSEMPHDDADRYRLEGYIQGLEHSRIALARLYDLIRK